MLTYLVLATLALAHPVTGAVWRVDGSQSETRAFDLAVRGYRKASTEKRPYDIDIYGRTSHMDGSIRFDFAHKSIILTGLDLPLPIDVHPAVVVELKRVCDELIAACDERRAPTVDEIKLGDATCSVDYIIPDSLQPVASITIHHSSGERFSIGKVGFVAFALGQLERVRRDVLAGFDATAERLKAEGTALLTEAFERKYGSSNLIASGTRDLNKIGPLLGNFFPSEVARAEAEAKAILEQASRPAIREYQSHIERSRATFDGPIEEYVQRSVGKSAESCAQLLPDFPEVAEGIRRAAVDCRGRLLAEARRLVQERTGRDVAALLSEERTLKLKLTTIPRGSTTYSPAEQVKVNALNALIRAMAGNEIRPSDRLEADRALKDLTHEVAGFGRFTLNPEFESLTGQLDTLRNTVRRGLGVELDDLVLIAE